MLDIVILAAGKGRRMQSALPKVLHPIAGKPLIEHVIGTTQTLPQNALNIIVGHGADRVTSALKNYSANVIKQQQQLGTGHAVQQALPYLHDNGVVLILYGDVPLIRQQTLMGLVNKASPNSLGLLTVTLDKPQGYGRIVRNSESAVTAIVEQKDANNKQLDIKEVNTGVMAVSTTHLQQWLPNLANNNAQGEYYLTDIIAMAQQQGIVINTQQPDDTWEVLGVNDRCQQAQLERIYQRNLAQQFMANGVTLLDPSRFDCRGELIIGSDTIIDINSIFKGKVTIGNNVNIGANCIIENTSIADGTVIKDNTILENTQVGSYCTIGPFARLRPGTVLAEQSKIGNFVETKKTIIGKGSKVNHLSYVGDSILGEEVNIGAGTITCNYDGVNKHQTIIGDNVFIGSNTALVAPINIADGATIGAGSTINKAVAKNTLSLTRPPQRVVKDWQRPTKNKQ